MSTFGYNDENKAKMMEVAEYLRGTSKSLEEGLATQFGEEPDATADFDIELLRALDAEVMMCEVCNWWCETHKINENQVCNDCEPEVDDE